MGTPTVISIFAGCGGSSLGYGMAGYRELLAIDFDKSAADTFRLNFPGVALWQRDIRLVAVGEILDFCGLRPGQLDVLDGSPPCQGFSIARGIRQVMDSRNDLFREFVRLLEGLRPKIFVMENVLGMATGVMRGRFREIMAALKGADYDVKCRRMNAMYYGTPQSRRRLIFLGARADLGMAPSYPRPQTRPMTVREALRDCPQGRRQTFRPDSKVPKIMALVPQGGYAGSYNPKGHYFTCRKLAWDRPACTLIRGGGGRIYHPDGDRLLTDTEWRRLGGYPDTFLFAGSRRRWTEGIGDGVPPPLMAAIAKHIKTEMLGKIRGEGK